MTRPSIHARPLLVLTVTGWLMVAFIAPAAAQPGSNSPNQFGDRQAGQWGDPGKGYFGNPTTGEFDKKQIKPPPPGARPLGRVYSGKTPEPSPYVTLPAPVDATPAAAPTKKPAKQRASKKTSN